MSFLPVGEKYARLEETGREFRVEIPTLPREDGRENPTLPRDGGLESERPREYDSDHVFAAERSLANDILVDPLLQLHIKSVTRTTDELGLGLVYCAQLMPATDRRSQSERSILFTAPLISCA